jgi:hypothetical protein
MFCDEVVEHVETIKAFKSSLLRGDRSDPPLRSSRRRGASNSRHDIGDADLTCGNPAVGSGGAPMPAMSEQLRLELL